MSTTAMKRDTSINPREGGQETGEEGKKGKVIKTKRRGKKEKGKEEACSLRPRVGGGSVKGEMKGGQKNQSRFTEQKLHQRRRRGRASLADPVH